jgi:hypothetical protein
MLNARAIERGWVERVLEMPEWTKRDPRNPNINQAFGRIAEARGKVLRVVYIDLRDQRRVITAFFDRDAVKPGG